MNRLIQIKDKNFLQQSNEYVLKKSGKSFFEQIEILKTIV